MLLPTSHTSMCARGGEGGGGGIWYVSTMCDMNNQFAIFRSVSLSLVSKRM